MLKSSRRKGRVIKTATRSYRSTYIIVGVVAAIIAASAGYYAYSSAHSTITSSSVTTESTGTTGFVYAKISTSLGAFEVELFKNETPVTVDNFVNLAESGFYTDLVWHRIVRQSSFDLIQTGDPTSRNATGNPCDWGAHGSNRTIPLEIQPYLHNYVGYLGMASTSAPNSATSQFYINLSNNTELDGKYAVFGKVISGLNVAQSLGNLPIDPNCQGGSTDGPPQNPSGALVLSITIQDTP